MNTRDRQNRRRVSTRGSSYDEAPRVSRRGEVRPAGGPGWDAGLKVAFVGFLLACAAVAIRLVGLQVIDAADLRARGTENVTNQITLTAKRGTIYDRNGNVLATSVECKTIYANPTQVTDVDKLAALLAQDLGGKTSDFTETLKKDTTFAYVKRRVDSSVATQLQKDLQEAELSGIYFLDDTKRVYPYGDVAGQILGIVGIDGDGLTGLELKYNDVLKGTDGTLTMETGLDGTPIAGGATKEVDAQDGQDIVLSIDVDIQQMAEEKIAQAAEDYSADSGSVMVVNPKNGEILAACSTPLLTISDTSESTNEQMQLKPVSDSYEPGSVFKVLLMAAALDSGAITENSSYTVPAHIALGQHNVGDDDGRSTPEHMDIREILRRSSNTGAVMVEQSLGSQGFTKYIKAFGIGEKTGIDYPGETTGLVDLENTNLGYVAFGQGIALPMVQMVKAYTAIANDGVMSTPHFLISQAGQTVDWSSSQTQVISKETSDTLTDMMRTVMDSGTGMAGNVDGYDIAGKTGTGEQAAEDGSGYAKGKYLSSLIGFANADDPEVMVYVGLNGTDQLSSSSSAPAFGPILTEAMKDMGIQPSSTTE